MKYLHISMLILLTLVSTTVQANQAPKANNVLYNNTEDYARVHNVMFNDSDPDGDAIYLYDFTQPSHGSTSKSSNNVLYTPASNYCGMDSFTYRIKDSKGAISNSATITIDITCVNDKPIANNVLYNNTEDYARVHNVMFNDSDPDGDAIYLYDFTQPSHGSTSKSSNNVLYTPASNYCGMDSFTYRIKDSKGAISNSATITIDITCVNDKPIANNVTYSNVEVNRPGKFGGGFI